MAGKIRVKIGGKEYVAKKNYHVAQHSGAPEDTRAFTPEWALRAMARAGVDPEDLEGGDVTVVVDDELVSKGMSKWPEEEVGSAEQGGFGFGGLGAKIDILNYGYTAQRSFSVKRTGTTGHGTDAYTTIVDGEVDARDDEMRPFQIVWEAGGGGDLDIGLGGGLGF